MINVTQAMILAAGFGTRMRPLTNTMPKPLVKVAGKRLIEYATEKLKAAGVTKAVVNGHYLAEQIEQWSTTVAAPALHFSDERDAILDTGGGIVRALPQLGAHAFFVMNADCFWVDANQPALERLKLAWNDSQMDCLLLLCDPARTTGYDGEGDFVLDTDGRISRARHHKNAKALAYIGGYLVHPRLFSEAPSGAFSMNLLWDRAIAQKRLCGLAHDGHWLHVGTVEAITEAEDWLRRK